MDLKSKLIKEFSIVATNKELVASEAITRRLPSFISEWLIGKFYAGRATKEAKKKLHSFIYDHLPPKSKKEEVKAELREIGTYKLIDEFSVITSLEQDRYILKIPALDITNAEINEYLVRQHKLLLSGGLWGAGVLTYDKNTRKITMTDFQPLQISNVDLDLFIQKRASFTIDEWIQLLFHTQGLNPDFYQSENAKMHILARLIPIVEQNVNIIELSPKGTGKSYVFKNLSHYVHLISGGTVTKAQLFYDLRTPPTPGLILLNDAVIFDEIQTISFDRPGETVGILKDYMESGSFSRGKQKSLATSSVVMLGNIKLDKNLQPIDRIYFYNLPKPMQESALIDRIHGLIPGWEIPKIGQSDLVFSKEYGLAVDYFSEILHLLKDRLEHQEYIKSKVKITGTKDYRDEKAVYILASGLCKLFFPDLNVTDDELEHYCLNYAIRYRQIVKDQLVNMDPEFRPVNLGFEFKE